MKDQIKKFEKINDDKMKMLEKQIEKDKENTKIQNNIQDNTPNGEQTPTNKRPRITGFEAWPPTILHVLNQLPTLLNHIPPTPNS